MKKTMLVLVAVLFCSTAFANASNKQNQTKKKQRMHVVIKADTSVIPVARYMSGEELPTSNRSFTQAQGILKAVLKDKKQLSKNALNIIPYANGGAIRIHYSDTGSLHIESVSYNGISIDRNVLVFGTTK